MSLRAVLFDLDDTLLIDEAVSRECFLLVADIAKQRAEIDPVRFVADAESIAIELHKVGPHYKLCHGIGISAFECLWGEFGVDEQHWAALSGWVEGYRDDVWGRALKEQKVEDPSLARELADTWKRERRARQKLMANANELIDGLRGTYKLGMLTNGAPGLQREKITASGLEESFDAIAISGAVGVGKPKPGVFHWLLDKLGVTAEEAVMVGNSLERDIAGARAVNMRCVYIVSADTETDTEHRPDHVIHDLAELPALLEEM